MEITERYRKRLVHLAKEIMALNKPTVISIERDQDKGELIKLMRVQFDQKLAHLLGYILALDDGEEAGIL